MQTFEIKPKVGVGPIRFGMTREEVRKQFGSPEEGDQDREWYLDDMAIDFDASGRVTFIELAESENFRAILDDKCLHELAAEDAVAHVQRIAEYDPNAPEVGYAYVFPALQLSLWRPVLPENDQDPDDPTGRHFEAVGVAADNYFPVTSSQ
ncbi:outer membrane protein assembly factor BamE [Candidatus Laterigemmans baculatus]|uniref:outer membrane protein assembly factor BamE n=1 Tax=Candidatus Laterigemmans baculatus TaxID=2770505 RepID=UPI0013DA23A3|nr:outer membrane protein assembly factor BamE [Candidatus Laterigemmans baculatus]